MIQELKELGSGNVTGKGHIAGIAVAVEGWSGYYPIQHQSKWKYGQKTRVFMVARYI